MCVFHVAWHVMQDGQPHIAARGVRKRYVHTFIHKNEPQIKRIYRVSNKDLARVRSRRSRSIWLYDFADTIEERVLLRISLPLAEMSRPFPTLFLSVRKRHASIAIINENASVCNVCVDRKRTARGNISVPIRTHKTRAAALRVLGISVIAFALRSISIVSFAPFGEREREMERKL